MVLVLRNPPANAGDVRVGPWVGKIPWRREWPPTPVFLFGESHGQRSLVGYSCKESRHRSDLTHTHIRFQKKVFKLFH